MSVKNSYKVKVEGVVKTYYKTNPDGNRETRRNARRLEIIKNRAERNERKERNI